MGQIDEILGQAGRELSAFVMLSKGKTWNLIFCMHLIKYIKIMTLLVIRDESNKTILTKEITVKRPRSTVVAALFKKE